MRRFRSLLIVLLALVAAVGVMVPAGVATVSKGAAARPNTGRLTPRLAALAGSAFRRQSPSAQARALSLPERGAGSLMQSNGRVMVDVRFTSGVARHVADLRRAGAVVLHVSRQYQVATVAVRPAALRQVAAVSGVETVMEDLQPETSSTCPQGAKVSEGDGQLNAATARTNFGVDGTGVKVGILSDSYNQFTTGEGAPTTAPDDVNSGDLQGSGNTCTGQSTPVQVPHDEDTGGEDEGRAMLQIVHDMAPGANQAFSTAFVSETAFADNIRGLATAGANVIVDDVTYFDEPFFQDGPVSVAVNDVTATGHPYFSSAANNNIIVGGHNVASWEAPAFRPTSCPATTPAKSYINSCMDFDPGAGTDNDYSIQVPNQRTLKVDLQWAQPWFGVTTDFDEYLLDGAGNILAMSENTNSHGQSGTIEEPFEVLSFKNTSGSTQTYRLVINRYTASGGGDTGTPRLKIILLQNGATVTPTEYQTSSGGDIVGPTIFGHNGAANTISVAAVPYNNSAMPETYSSRGPLTLYFGPASGTTAAAPLGSPMLLNKPDIAATDCGVNTFFLPPGPPYRFCGTSAAAPHAGGVAALLLDVNGSATVAQVKSALTSTAVPVGAFGPSDVGAGLIDANAAAGAINSAPTQHTLQVNFAGTGTGQVTSNDSQINCTGNPCSHSYTDSTNIITLTAAADSSRMVDGIRVASTFTGWSGAGCSGTGQCQVQVNGANVNVTATFTANSVQQFQPDLWVRFGSGPWQGQDVHNTTGLNQIVKVKGPPGANGTFSLELQNDATAVDGFTLKGPGNGSGLTIKYKSGTTCCNTPLNVSITNLGPGSKAPIIKITIHIKSTAATGTRKLKFIATSQGDGTRDVVIIQVRVT